VEVSGATAAGPRPPRHSEPSIIRRRVGLRAMGVIEVSLRRVPLDKRELRQTQSETEHPLGPWLREQYV
jgi:hypothetical protein